MVPDFEQLPMCGFLEVKTDERDRFELPLIQRGLGVYQPSSIDPVDVKKNQVGSSSILSRPAAQRDRARGAEEHGSSAAKAWAK